MSAFNSQAIFSICGTERSAKYRAPFSCTKDALLSNTLNSRIGIVVTVTVELVTISVL